MKMTLLYQGSRDGWSAKEFHERCNEKGSTVSLFKMDTGDVIGGFTSAQWKSSGGGFSPCEMACLFSLTNHTLFPVFDHTIAISCSDDEGPYFGFMELSTWGEYFNDRICYSDTNKRGYSIPLNKDGKNALTRVEGDKFTITE